MIKRSRTSAIRLERLVQDTFRLRRIIAQNITDNNLLKEKIEFRYWVDTTIFNIYAEPGRNFRNVAAFPSLISDEADEEIFDEDVILAGELDLEDVPKTMGQRERNANFANALLAGEFIFKTASRDSRYPILVSPEHASEIYSYVESLERRSRSVFRRSEHDLREVYASLQHRLLLEAESARTRHPPSDDWLRRVSHSIVALLADASSSPLLAPYRLKTLFTHGAIANAASALNLPDEVISPPYDVLSRWRREVRNAKRFHKILPSSIAIDADAVTLAQLQYANENWRDKRCVCVLITSDRGLHRAYSDWRKDERRRSGRTDLFYPLRDPLQYTPILNVSDMKGQYRDDKIFSRVERSIREFVASFSSTDVAPFRNYEEDPSKLPDPLVIRAAIRHRMAEHRHELAPFAAQIRHEVEEIRSVWIEAIELSVAAKTDVITELAHQDLQLWREASSRRVLSQGLVSQIDDLRESFENLATSSTLLRQEIWALEHGTLSFDASNKSHSRRALASDFVDYATPDFRGKTLHQILGDLRQKRAEAIPMLRAAVRAERLFVTGCLSLQIGAWAGAKALLDRAVALEESRQSFALEIRLFHCMSRRLAADVHEFQREYEEVRNELSGLRAREDSGPRRGSDPRVRNEQLALELCELAFLSASSRDVSSQIRDGSNIWARMVERYGNRLTEPSPLEYWQAVTRQFLLNTYNLLFWATVAEIEIPDDLRHCASASLVKLDDAEFLHVTSSFHGRLYPMLAKFVLETSQAEKTELRLRIGDCIEEALVDDEESGFAIDVPFVDKAEFIGILRHVDPLRIPTKVRLS